MPARLPPEVRAAVQVLIREGGGIVSRAGLLEIGLTPSQVDYLARAGGGWTRIHSGVYATFTGQLTQRQRLRAVVLYVGRDVVISGYHALRLRGVRGLPTAEAPVHALIAHAASRQSTEGLRVERTVVSVEYDDIDGFRVARVPRAVVDEGRHATDPDVVRHLVGLVIRLRRATVTELQTELERATSRGSALLREALGGAARGVRGAEESRLRDRLLAAGLAEPLWNVHLYTENGDWVAYVDGFLDGIALEMQTREFHLYIDRWETDVARLSRLNSYGVMVQLATPRFLRRSWHEFEADLRRALASGVGQGSRLLVGDPPEWWGNRAA